MKKMVNTYFPGQIYLLSVGDSGPRSKDSGCESRIIQIVPKGDNMTCSGSYRGTRIDQVVLEGKLN